MPSVSRLIFPAFLLGLAASLSGCGGVSTLDPDGLQSMDAGSSKAQPETGESTIGSGSVKTALIVPLTGTAAANGSALRNAAQLAMEEFKKPGIQILVKDDHGTPEGARQATQAALDEGADLVIGPLLSSSVQAAAAVARPAGKPVIAFSTDESAAGRGVYLLSFMPGTEVDRIINYTADQGKTAFAALIPDTPYGRVIEGRFQQAVSQRGGRVVALERVASDKASVDAAVKRLASVVGGPTPGAEALFIPMPAESLPALGASLKAAGLDPTHVQLLGTSLWNEGRVLKTPELQSAWFAAPPTSGYGAFAKRYRDRFSKDPTRTATLAYDAVSLAAALVRTQNPQQRFSERVLTSGSGFAGADGIFRFRADGMNERALSVYTIHDSAAVIVDGAPRTLVAATP